MNGTTGNGELTEPGWGRTRGSHSKTFRRFEGAVQRSLRLFALAAESLDVGFIGSQRNGGFARV